MLYGLYQIKSQKYSGIGNKILFVVPEGVMVCYFGSWAVYRQGDGKFDIEDIDPNICTHLIFGFAGLGYDNKIRVSERVSISPS